MNEALSTADDWTRVGRNQVVWGDACEREKIKETQKIPGSPPAWPIF